MFELNSKTQVNKKFKLSELYKVIGADKTIKADSANILSVTLTNVLNENTLNFSAKGEVKEIYVFELVLNSKTIPTLFISALDKATNLHTIFVLRNGNKCMLYGAYKEYGERGMKIGKYYFTDWTGRAPITLPLTVACLEDIYTAIINELVPISARVDESTRDFVNRYGEITRLQKEIDKLQCTVDSEKQSKKRFELNAELKELKKELERYE